MSTALEALRALIVEAACGATALKTVADQYDSQCLPRSAAIVRKQSDQLQRAVMRAMHAVRVNDTCNQEPTQCR